MRVTFVLADTWVTFCSLTHENEHRPYRKRTVTIELTSEQIQQLVPRRVGEDRGKVQVEEILECFLENENGEPP